jgi:beta-lactamase regulating signal transducer with metallopeptidase domain
MSISGSVIALLLFALKPLIKNRLPKSSQYYLWLIVIAVLLVPVSKFVTIPQYAEHIPPVPIYSIVEWNVISTQEQNERIMNIQQENPIITDFSSQESPLSGIVDAAFVIYPIGVAAILLYQLIAYMIFIKKTLRGSRVSDIECKIPVYFNTKATTPMLVGLFKPKIILPDREYSDEQLQAVLLHEMTHLRRKDILVKWLSMIACAVHWFNPIVWLVRREIDRACELSCDEAVIAKLDASGRQTYGDTLIYVAADHKPHTALAMSESGRNLKERLRAIMKNKKRTRIAVIVSVVLLVFVAGEAIVLGAGENTTITLNSLLGKTVNMGPAVGDPPAVDIPSTDTGYLKSAVFAVGDEQDGYLFGVNFVMPMSVSVGGNSENPPVMPGTSDCRDLINKDGEKVGCVGYNVIDYEQYLEDPTDELDPMMVYSQIALGGDYFFEIRDNYNIVVDNDRMQTAATFVFNSLSDMPGIASEQELSERNYGIVSFSKVLPVYVAFEFEKSVFTDEQIAAIAASLEFIGKGIEASEVDIPNVQIFVYDDGQGNERYVMFGDNEEHSREEIMSAQTVTIDEINEVFAGFTSRFRFEIRAMSHDDFDKARLDKISAQIVFPDDVERYGVISFVAY